MAARLGLPVRDEKWTGFGGRGGGLGGAADPTAEEARRTATRGREGGVLIHKVA